jgi:hypothetical protein
VKITVVSPHRGDAAFALGLSIEGWLRRGQTVEVLNCFTRSEFAPYSDVQSVHENDRMSFATAVRKREDEAWRKLYRTPKLILTDLNLKDAPARLHCAPEDVFRRQADTSEKLTSKIRKALALSNAGALVLPLACSTHVDYVSARDTALLDRTEMTPLAFYEELPLALHVTRAQTEAALEHLRRELRSELHEKSVCDDAGSTAEPLVGRRREFALCYDSQIDEKATNEIAAFCRTKALREPLWVNPAWAAHSL